MVMNPWPLASYSQYYFHFSIFVFNFSIYFLFSGVTTRDSAAASKFTALTYISDCKQEEDWSSL